MKNSTLDRMIDNVVPKTRTKCGVCEDKALTAAVARWLQRRAAGETLPCLNTMTEQCFSTIAPLGYCTIARHVKRCLGLDHRTGRKL